MPFKCIADGDFDFSEVAINASTIACPKYRSVKAGNWLPRAKMLKLG